MATKLNNIAVLGAGSWGTALALALARNQHNVSLWAHTDQHIQAMRLSGSNERYLPGFTFPENLLVEGKLSHLADSHTTFLLAVPSHAFRQTITSLKDLNIDPESTIIWATKGFDSGNDESGPQLLSSVVTQVLGNDINHAIVSGPSFSKEVAGNLPTAITTAGSSSKTTDFVAQLFHGERMRIYTNPDLIGVQVGGAIKNVMAIAAGISDGLGFGANSRSAIITRGLAEIARLGVSLGAQPDTFQGLAGMGDLILTCTDDQSRNRRFGLGLGQGNSVQSVLRDIGQEVEGYITAQEVIRLAKVHKVEMPISEQVFQVLYHKQDPNQAVNTLLNRRLINE